MMIVVKEREGEDVVERFLVKSCPLPGLKFPGQGPRENTATFSQNNAGNFLTNNAVVGPCSHPPQGCDENST